MAKGDPSSSEPNRRWTGFENGDRSTHENGPALDRPSNVVLSGHFPHEKSGGSAHAAREHSDNADKAAGVARVRSTSITTADGTTVTGIVQSRNRGQDVLSGVQGSRHTFGAPDSNSTNGYLINNQGERTAIVSRKSIDGFDAFSQCSKPTKASAVASAASSDRKPEDVVPSAADARSVRAETMRQQSSAEGQSQKLPPSSERVVASASSNGNKGPAEANNLSAVSAEVRRASGSIETVIASVDKVPVARGREILQQPVELGRTAGEVVFTKAQPVRDVATNVSSRCEAKISERQAPNLSNVTISGKNDGSIALTDSRPRTNEVRHNTNPVSQPAIENAAKMQCNSNSRIEVAPIKPIVTADAAMTAKAAVIADAAVTVDAAVAHRVNAASDKFAEDIDRREIAFKCAAEPTNVIEGSKTSSTNVIGGKAESASAEGVRDENRMPDHGSITPILSIPENLVSGHRGLGFTMLDGKKSKALDGEKSPGASSAPKLDISLAVKLADPNTKMTTVELIKLLEQCKVDPEADASSKRLAGVARQLGSERLAELRQLIETSENGKPPRFEGVDAKTLAAYRRILTLIMDQIGSSQRKPNILSQNKSGESKAVRCATSDTNTVITAEGNDARTQRKARQLRPEFNEGLDIPVPAKRRIDFVKELLGVRSSDNSRESYFVRFCDLTRCLRCQATVSDAGTVCMKCQQADEGSAEMVSPASSSTNDNSSSARSHSVLQAVNANSITPHKPHEKPVRHPFDLFGFVDDVDT